ncbi:glycosyltransferase family 2 protein [Phytoactinopolyspora mesophila]|uniref:Glycosyltransferase n=1 Tax=Phytoactinopolyspora mesophila TaxID=2650750 RepID=A0A7K3M4U3_9ACTN|nr:glycosyltransferase family 2 protein [Phytoactinopolyspora mesophila]NDL57438.1 glycosyltransferase [Phytoactinopolyspora mesophila]
MHKPQSASETPAHGGQPDEAAGWPAVSVIMPVRDEERHLADAVARVLSQDYPGEMEVVLAIAPSRDRTAQIAADLAAGDTRIRLVDNPAGKTPAGLNAAIGEARHGIVVRVDGHGLLSEGYIRSAVEVLEKTGAANVGGIMHAEGTTDFERAVACAYGSTLGLGGGRFHVGGPEGPADTVYLGVFRRDVLERLGGYDEHFVRAQDWELNYRIRADGESVWFTPHLTVTYRPRPTLRALAKQFLRTGQWRREVVRKYPDTASVRYLAPPVVLIASAVGTLAGLAAMFGAPGWLSLGWLAPGGYAAGALAASVAIGRGLPVRARCWLPAVLMTVHLSWGAGFLTGPARSRSAGG